MGAEYPLSPPLNMPSRVWDLRLCGVFCVGLEIIVYDYGSMHGLCCLAGVALGMYRVIRGPFGCYTVGGRIGTLGFVV